MSQTIAQMENFHLVRIKGPKMCANQSVYKSSPSFTHSLRHFLLHKYHYHFLLHKYH